VAKWKDTIMRTKRENLQKAFTLIELLVVIAIIAMLLGIISVGVRQATITAKNLRQKAIFHGIEVGLELFSKDFDGYPSSKTLTSVPNSPAGADAVCGAQHLAEALVGQDNRGFDPKTKWYPPTQDPLADPYIYSSTEAQSLNRRKEQYCDIKRDSLYSIYELWKGGAGTSNIYTSALNSPDSPVITDVFTRNSVDGMDDKVGLPILYFKADSTKQFRVNQTQQTVTNPTSAQYSQWIYNFDDNLPVVTLPRLDGEPDTDFADIDNDGVVDNQAQVFYEKITQTADTTRNFYKPFNPNGFILISAGWDGIYGTKDDITNFAY
jgi:prepilin-type N-terminal cleavage/methylation domain-containing protein